MRKVYFFLMAFLAVVNTAIAAPYTWTGPILNGDYANASNWTPVRTTPNGSDILTFNSTASITITNVPTETIAGIVIGSGTFAVSLSAVFSGVLTINSATPLSFSSNGSLLAGNFITINLPNPAAFSISTGSFGIAPGMSGKIIINSALNLTGGTLSFDAALSTGNATITGSITYTSGNFLCNNAGMIIWASGSNYFHALSGAAPSAIPAATWQGTSTCNIKGMNGGNNAPTGLSGISFTNFNWECASQSVDIDLNLSALPTTVNITGAFTIKNTNGKYLRLAGAAGGKIVAGSYAQTLGNVMLQSSTGTTTLSVTGSFSHTGGTINGLGNGVSTGIGILDLKGEVKQTATWISSSTSPSSQMNIQFSGTAVQAVSITGTWSPPVAGRTNIFVTNTNTTSGVALAAGSILRVYNTNSPIAAVCEMGGKITPANATSVVSYSGLGAGGLTLVYNSLIPQTASVVEFPSTAPPTNLTINNPLGVSFPTAPVFDRTISGTLTMTAGNLSIGAGNTLSLTNTSLPAQITYGSVNGYITTGRLGRNFPAAGVPTAVTNDGRFPFGAGVNDRSLYLSFSNSSIGAGGTVFVTHNNLTGVTVIAPTISDGGINLDKKTVTNWIISTTGLNLGVATASLTAVAGNIGSVDFFSRLRLTDGLTSYGTFISPNGGSNTIPVTGKTNLSLIDLNKILYIGSDGSSNNPVDNPLSIITFKWKGSAGNTDWDQPNNWNGAVGYPSASTEIAIIDNSFPPLSQPTIKTGQTFNVFQLTVGPTMTLTMAAGSVLNVYDDVIITPGTTAFTPTSIFGYASSSGSQAIKDLPYGSLALSGTATKNLPATITVTGSYSAKDGLVNTALNTFIYAGSGAQTIATASYNNLTITGNRGGGIITLGNLSGNIDIANAFDVSGLSVYSNPPLFPLSFVNVNFNSTGIQALPGFYYPILELGPGIRVFDPLGSGDPLHVIYARSFSTPPPGITNIITGSKVNFYVSGQNPIAYNSGFIFNDFEITGDAKNKLITFTPGAYKIGGKFKMSVTNYQQDPSKGAYFIFNGTGDQTIYAYNTTTTPGNTTPAPANTPAFIYPNIIIHGGNRNVIFGGFGAGKDTIKITGSLQVPRTLVYNTPAYYFGQFATINPFSASKGFIVDSSTISFSVAADLVPKLIPSAPGTNNYNNVDIISGVRIVESDMTFGGNLSLGDNFNTATLLAPASLKVGDGINNRVLNVLGNITVAGVSPIAELTGQIDLNPGSIGGTTTINIGKNLSINGKGQITGNGSVNGTIVFNGALPQTYFNNSTFKNEFVNFKVGDGVKPNCKLTLLSKIDLNKSATAGNIGTLSVLPTDSLDCGLFNITGNGALGNAKFELKDSATLITANTGGIEGLATSPTDGSIINDATIVKTYSPLANYVFNATANTNTNFPAATTPFPMANLTFGDNAATATFSLTKQIDVSNTLVLKNNCTLALLENYLNLKSTATKTARLAEVPANANITYGTNGRFVVERFYPARRAWRLVTAPITADAGRSIFNSWQLGGKITPVPDGNGTYVSGAIAANGIDASPQMNTSLKTYDGTNFIGVADTKTQLLSGTTGAAGIPDNFGMFLFVRGDRSTQIDLFNTANANNTTLKDTGKVQIKSQTFTLNNAAANGFNLVGNPYASPVDINSIMAASTNINPLVFYAYDPNINTQQGAYVTMSYLGGNWTAIPSRAGGQDKNIQSGQSIFVQKSNIAAGTMVFNESNKSSQNNLSLFREASQASLFRTNLFLKETDTTILADGNLVAFDNTFNSGVDLSDALKFGNIKESFGLIRDTKNIAVERRQPVALNDTLFFKLSKTTQRNYQLQFVPTNIDAFLTAFLEDNYTGTKTIVSLTSNSTADFTVNSDAKSAATDRFKIVFKSSITAPLPVTYKSIKAYQLGKNIQVEWTVENEININKYEVEKSIDGINFTKVNTTVAKANSGSNEYNFLDKNPLEGDNFYRILSYNQNGAFDYSRAVLVKMGEMAKGISIYPNPVTNNSIGVAINNPTSGKYNLRLINTLGQTMLTKILMHTAGNSMETVTPNNKLSVGIYQLEVTAPDKTVSIIKVVVQTP